MITNELLKWLNDHAYAVKGEEYWFLPDFDTTQKPDRLEIPMTKKLWHDIQPPSGVEERIE